MYQLYYSPGACSMAMHTALTELGVPFTANLVRTSEGEHKKPEYLAINPFGWVPTLITPQGVTITEGIAILLYLADAHPSALFPAPGATAERATALTWLAFANASLHTAYSRYFSFLKLGITEGPAIEAAMANINSMWGHVETRLGQTKFLCGDQPTFADILTTVIGNWLSGKVSFGPNTQRLFKAISSRPAFQQVLQAEGVEYKAAA